MTLSATGLALALLVATRMTPSGTGAPPGAYTSNAWAGATLANQNKSSSLVNNWYTVTFATTNQ